MKHFSLVVGVLAAGVLGSLFLAAIPQDAGMGDDPMAGMTEEMMPQPGPQHELLASAVGTWDAVVTMYTPMGEMEMHGTDDVEMFGPFHQTSNFSGEFMGEPFKGRATMSYDPIRDEWVTTWIDSMSPWASIMRGTADESGRTLTFTHQDPNMMGEIVDKKTVMVFKDDGSHTHTTWAIADDGTEVKEMHIEYMRKQGAGR